MSFNKRLQFSCFCLATLAAFFAPVYSQKNEFDIPALLGEAKQRSDENSQRMTDNLFSYTFKVRKVWRETTKGGKVEEKSELHEILLPSSCRSRSKKCWRSEGVLLEKNGEAIAPEKIEKERIKAGERLERIDHKSATAERNAKVSPVALKWMHFGYFVRRFSEIKLIVAINGQEVLEKCEFFAPRRETVGGREMISLSFRPRANSVFEEATKYMPNVEGKIWIDTFDKVFVRLAMWEKGAKFENQTSDYLLENAALVFDMTRTKEGIWFIRLGRINGLKYPNLFAEMKSDFSMESFNYHFFKTEVKDVEIKNPMQNNK